MVRLIASLLCTLPLILRLPAPAAAQEIRTERLQFKAGATSAVIEGKIKGDETIDYLIGARQGQAMNASLATKHGATYFNIMAPGSKDEAFFIGSTSGNQYEGTLPASGDYRLRVYMMRSAARRNEVANYRLEVIITGDEAAPASHDATVAGTPFHATGMVPCSSGSGAPTGQCPFGVVRRGAGDADVTVTLPTGHKRTIMFEKGRPVRSDAPAASGAFGASKTSDLNVITIGTERYEIPDAVVLGG